MRRRSLQLATLIALVWTLVASRARADATTGRATFALVIGANRSVDTELAPLKYADDDAARYLDLFRLLGARTYLLARLDDNTRRIHPQAAAEALEPRKASLDAAVAQLTADVAQAASRNVETVVYFVYAGHGNVRNGQGYITLEDARLGGADLAAIFAKLQTKRIHVIVDACASYFLAYGRGPGGQRRAVAGFSASHELTGDPRVGLLLSTSSARESHEWEAFQAGVFSHEVRSGLYGAADADGDGVVSYREIAAFVARANASVPNERYRPDVHTRVPPDGDDALFDLKKARKRRLEIDGAHAGHWQIEDARGVRVLDLHNAPGQSLAIVRPPLGALYLRRAGDDKELRVPPADDVLSVADLAPEDGRVASRGAAHESFSALFSLPFDRAVVDAYEPPPIESAPEVDAATPMPAGAGLGARRIVGLAVAGAGVALVGVGVAGLVTASAERDAIGPNTPQSEVAGGNDRISTWNTVGAVGFVAGGAALATGALLFFWPAGRAPATPPGSTVSVAPLPSGGFVGWRCAF